MEGIDPPRGFAFAWFKIGNGSIGVYSVHLKSNLVTHGDPVAETAKNIRKREIAIDQLMTHVRDFIGAKIPAINRFIIGGDFNTNHALLLRSGVSLRRRRILASGLFDLYANHGTQLDGKRFVVRADEILTAFLELEASILTEQACPVIFRRSHYSS